MSKKLNTKAFDAPLNVTLPKPPTRTPVPEPEADRFVEEAVPAAEAPAKSAAAVPRAASARVSRPSAGKSPARGTHASRLRREASGERVVAYVPTDLATDLRVACARSRRSMSDAVTEALAMWLSAYSNK
jgi:hypothetical protein